MKESKSIEERANAYIGHPFEVDEDSAITMARVAYIQGATEQEALDEAESGKELLYVAHKTTERVRKEVIEKACEWWSRELREVNYETYDETIEAFRKAMEE